MKPEVVICDEHRLQAEGLVHGLSRCVQDGIDIVSQLHKRAPNTRVVVVTMWNDPAVATEVLRRGASAYVLKSSEASEVFDAVRSVLSGTT